MTISSLAEMSSSLERTESNESGDFDWLRAYLDREEARTVAGSPEKDTGNSSQTGSTTETESVNGSYPRAVGCVPQTSAQTEATLALGFALSFEGSGDEDEEDASARYNKRRRKVRPSARPARRVNPSPLRAWPAAPAPHLPPSKMGANGSLPGDGAHHPLEPSSRRSAGPRPRTSRSWPP